MDYKAFMSYTDADNNFEGQYFDKLRDRLIEAVQVVGGEKIGIFRNSDVEVGQRAKNRIAEVLRDVIFFIPVITPSFMADEHSCEQIRQFMQREQQLGQRELILPIIFREPKKLATAEQSRLYEELKNRNPIVWPEKFRGVDSLADFELRTTVIERMAERIADTINQVPKEDAIYSSPDFQRLILQQFADLQRRFDELQRNGAQGDNRAMKLAYEEATQNIQRLIHERDTMLGYLMQANGALEAGRVVHADSDEAELVFVPAALFTPGPARDSMEAHRKARHFVRAYYIDKYPVTNARFQTFVERTSYVTVAERLGYPETWRAPGGPGSTIVDDHPVVCIFREDAVRYAGWAGRRLPTRLEWERAARGVAEAKWPWGDEWRDGACNIEGQVTTPVDLFPKGVSPVGCWDMIGNVWEWTADNLERGKLLLMGGSWAETRAQFPVGYKLRIAPSDGTDYDVGFRCALDAPIDGQL